MTQFGRTYVGVTPQFAWQIAVTMSLVTSILPPTARMCIGMWEIMTEVQSDVGLMVMFYFWKEGPILSTVSLSVSDAH